MGLIWDVYVILIVHNKVIRPNGNDYDLHNLCTL